MTGHYWKINEKEALLLKELMSSLDYDYMVSDIDSWKGLSDSEKETFSAKLKMMGIL